MTKKACELCGSAARMFCESDQASLCWDCDEKVHSANFLVAKHTRATLCHVCHSPTPWKASGPSIGRTISVCGDCICRSKGGAGAVAVEARMSEKVGREANHKNHKDEEMEAVSSHSRIRLSGSDERREEFDEVCHDDDDDDNEDSCSSDEYDDSDEDDDSDDVEDEDEDENQVVPWSSAPTTTTTSTASSSGEEEEPFAYRIYRAETESDLKRLCEIPTLFRSNVLENNSGGSPISSTEGTQTQTTSVKEDEEEEDDEFIDGGFGGRPWKQRRVSESSMIVRKQQQQ